MFPICENFVNVSVFNIIPAYRDIPEQFKMKQTIFNNLFHQWSFSGLSNLKMTAREGVDPKKAMAHIEFLMKVSVDVLRYDHKEAVVTYLLDQWFTDPKWTRGFEKDPYDYKL